MGDELQDRVEGLSVGALLRGLWWLPWLCVVQITYAIPRRLVMWVGEATIGRGVKYT